MQQDSIYAARQGMRASNNNSMRNPIIKVMILPLHLHLPVPLQFKHPTTKLALVNSLTKTNYTGAYMFLEQ